MLWERVCQSCVMRERECVNHVLWESVNHMLWERECVNHVLWERVSIIVCYKSTCAKHNGVNIPVSKTKRNLPVALESTNLTPNLILMQYLYEQQTKHQLDREKSYSKTTNCYANKQEMLCSWSFDTPTNLCLMNHACTLVNHKY